MSSNERKEKLLAVFLFEKPYIISYEYRKQYYKDDKAILDELVKEGLIVQIAKDNKRVTYKYIGDIQEGA